jgi:hypothetical protein
MVGVLVGCGDEDIDDGTGNADDSSTGMASDTAASTSASMTSTDGTTEDTGITTSGSSTTGGTGLCAEPNEQCLHFDEETCACNGCFDSCVPDRGAASDCVCEVCSEDRYCASPKGCKDGDGCDPFTEGCQCADCAEHPLCM